MNLVRFEDQKRRLEALNERGGALSSDQNGVIDAEILQERRLKTVKPRRGVVLTEQDYNNLVANRIGLICGLVLAVAFGASLIIVAIGISIGTVQSTQQIEVNK